MTQWSAFVTRLGVSGIEAPDSLVDVVDDVQRHYSVDANREVSEEEREARKAVIFGIKNLLQGYDETHRCGIGSLGKCVARHHEPHRPVAQGAGAVVEQALGRHLHGDARGRRAWRPTGGRRRA